MKLYFILNKRVRADDDINRTACNLLVERLAGFTLDAANQQTNRHAERLEQFSQRLGMLPRQNLGWRHECRLIASARRLPRCQSGHHCLAATNVALQQAIHRPSIFEILQDVPGGAALGAG